MGQKDINRLPNSLTSYFLTQIALKVGKKLLAKSSLYNHHQYHRIRALIIMRSYYDDLALRAFSVYSVGNFVACLSWIWADQNNNCVTPCWQTIRVTWWVNADTAWYMNSRLSRTYNMKQAAAILSELFVDFFQWSKCCSFSREDDVTLASHMCKRSVNLMCVRLSRLHPLLHSCIRTLAFRSFNLWHAPAPLWSAAIRTVTLTCNSAQAVISSTCSHLLFIVSSTTEVSSFLLDFARLSLDCC